MLDLSSGAWRVFSSGHASCETGRFFYVGVDLAWLGYVVRYSAPRREAGGSMAHRIGRMVSWMWTWLACQSPERQLEGRCSLLCSLLFWLPTLRTPGIARGLSRIPLDVEAFPPGCGRSKSQSLFGANHAPRSIGILPAIRRPGQEGRTLIWTGWCQPRHCPRHLPPCGRCQQGLRVPERPAYRQ